MPGTPRNLPIEGRALGAAPRMMVVAPKLPRGGAAAATLALLLLLLLLHLPAAAAASPDYLATAIEVYEAGMLVHGRRYPAPDTWSLAAALIAKHTGNATWAERATVGLEGFTDTWVNQTGNGALSRTATWTTISHSDSHMCWCP